jgi:peptidoglycan/LPS O-acetylase OafA/YrhL
MPSRSGVDSLTLFRWIIVRSPGLSAAIRTHTYNGLGSGTRVEQDDRRLPMAGDLAADLPATSGRNPALDGVRVLAALAVLLTHVGGQTGFAFTGTPASWVVSRGDVGVPIFFVLSGLLLYRPWARAVLTGGKRPAAGQYFVRRALRILPAYWVVVIVALCTLNAPHAGSVSTWVQYLLLVQNYNLHPWWYGTGADGLAQMWSLVVEVSFYLVLPVLAAALAWWAARASRGTAGTSEVSRRAWRLLAGIGVIGLSSYGIAVLAFYPSLRLWLGETLLRLMTWFAGGMLLAVMSEWAHAETAGAGVGPAARFCRTVAGSAEACWLIAAIAFVIACTPLAGPETLAIPTLWNTELKTALYTVVGTALVAPVAFQSGRPTWVTRGLGNRVMSFLGRISYGIFLWQFVVIYAFFAVMHARDAFQGTLYAWPAVLGIFVVVTVATVAMAALSYFVLERPLQRLYRPRESGPQQYRPPQGPSRRNRSRRGRSRRELSRRERLRRDRLRRAPARHAATGARTGPAGLAPPLPQRR